MEILLKNEHGTWISKTIFQIKTFLVEFVVPRTNRLKDIRTKKDIPEDERIL